MSRLAELLLLAIAAGLAAVLATAMALQYAGGEIPCPLCLLERVAMFGTAFAALAAVGTRATRPLGHALLWALTLLVLAARQTLLDIVPRPGHAYPGSAILGLHMPVWAVVVALALILALAAVLWVRGEDAAPRYGKAARVLGGVLLALAGVNLVSALVQCGFGECHTWGYVGVGALMKVQDENS